MQIEPDKSKSSATSRENVHGTDRNVGMEAALRLFNTPTRLDKSDKKAVRKSERTSERFLPLSGHR